ncbi:MAG: serpin family protein [Myxococcales bacterium]|jgi:serpin B
MNLCIVPHAAIVAVFALGACAPSASHKEPNTNPPPELETARSELPRATTPAPEADVLEVVRGNNGFGADLLARLRKPGENLLISPVSIQIAMAMTYAGARGQTETEIAQALRFTLPQSELHPAFGTLDLALRSRGEGAQGKDGQPFRLRISNAAWAQRGYPFVPEYLDVLAQSYGAGVNLLDFIAAPEPSRQIINEWVAYETEDRIPELLAEGSITPDTRLVLTNAVYFNAAWEKQFDEAMTRPGTFHLADGTPVQVPTMAQSEWFKYAEGADYQAIELPYDGGELSMLVILPAAGQLSSFEQSFDEAKLSSIVSALSDREVELRLPKFEFECKSSLKDALVAMGMPNPFTPAATFTGISPTGTLAIADVVHQTFIAVDESGTEAAAATAVIIGDTSVPITIPMVVDRPFLFAIRDVATGTVVFLGEVLDPR